MKIFLYEVTTLFPSFPFIIPLYIPTTGTATRLHHQSARDLPLRIFICITPHARKHAPQVCCMQGQQLSCKLPTYVDGFKSPSEYVSTSVCISLKHPHLLIPLASISSCWAHFPIMVLRLPLRKRSTKISSLLTMEALAPLTTTLRVPV